MTFSWDFNTATLLAIAAQIIIFIVYLVKTNGKAVAAYELAEKAMDRAEEAHSAVAAAMAGTSLLREHVATEYIDRQDLRDMEKRLTDLIKEVGARVDKHK